MANSITVGRRFGAWLVAVAAAGTAWGQAIDPAQLRPLLEHPIVDPNLPMLEVQHYCDARVPVMPNVTTAEQWQAKADQLRQRVLEQIVFRGRAAEWRSAQTRVEWLDAMEGGPGYRIRKLRYEALPGMWIPALLYEPEGLSGKVPAVLNVNGHTALGKQYPPKQIRCINQAKRGILALNVEWLGMGQLRAAGFSHARMNQLDLCGASGLAPFYLLMDRGLDVLLALEHTDPDRVAVTGLSGGGWQTIFISALDTRVRLSNPVAGYSSYKTRAWHLKDLGDSEQTPTDLATLVDYTHLTAMVAPRPLLLTFNSKDDCCFESGYALQPLVEAAQPIYGLFGREHALRTHVNHDPGTHNYELDNRQAFYRMLADFFYVGDSSFEPAEIPSGDEVRSEEELAVPLPEKNHDFHSLALQICGGLPQPHPLPEDEAQRKTWQAQRREQLGQIVRFEPHRAEATKAGEAEAGSIRAVYWRLAVGPWTVPAVELAYGAADKAAVLVADEGLASTSGEAAGLLGAGYRVLAIDPFYFGQSRIAERSYLFALLVAAVGSRPLGIQAAQTAAAASWLADQHQATPVTLVAVGPRSSVFALVAAALEPEAVAAVELRRPLATLKEVIEQDWTVADKPEQFCFGLLEQFDLKDIAALVVPRPVRLIDATPRAADQFQGLEPWCTWQLTEENSAKQ